MKVPDAFDEFDDFLKLNPAERARAILMHTRMQGALIKVKIVSDTFLQGSFKRKTMISPLRDIDVVAILHSRLMEYRSIKGGHETIMREIEEAVRREFPNATLVWGKHALLVDFGENDFSFDVVPAVECGDGTGDIEIINTQTGGWKRSNTRTLIETVAARNKACNGRFIHQARMGKQMAKNQPRIDLFGLIVESAAYSVIVSPMEHSAACAAIIDALLHGLNTKSLPDPTGTQNLYVKLSEEQVGQARTALSVLSGQAREALLHEQEGNDDAAIAVWHEVMGEGFPKPEDLSEDEVFNRLKGGGGLTSSGRATRSNPQVTARPTRAWRSY